MSKHEIKYVLLILVAVFNFSNGESCITESFSQCTTITEFFLKIVNFRGRMSDREKEGEELSTNASIVNHYET